jgi:hypothetical protein
MTADVPLPGQVVNAQAMQPTTQSMMPQLMMQQNTGMQTMMFVSGPADMQPRQHGGNGSWQHGCWSPSMMGSMPPGILLPDPRAFDPCSTCFSRPAEGSYVGLTTRWWGNLPNNYKRDQLMELIDKKGFAGSYDFFYAPVDFTRNALLGYAFINFLLPKEADRFYDVFDGFVQWELDSEKVSQVSWSIEQGLESHIKKYRNSPVMTKDDTARPVSLKDGQRVPFPSPTKKLQAPHNYDRRGGSSNKK